MSKLNILITGIPRSGTTLAAALVDSLPDTVCISEPNHHCHVRVEAPENSPVGFDYAKWLAGEFISIRKKFRCGEPVYDWRFPNGQMVTDYHPGGGGKPAAGSVRLNDVKPRLSADFNLAIKHNGIYLSALPGIVALGGFTVIALVRHPVHVLHSWRSLDMPISRGHFPDGGKYWPAMNALSRGSMELLQRHVRMYDLMCGRIFEYRRHIHILRYEEMVEHPQMLSEILEHPGLPDLSLLDKPARIPPQDQWQEIAQAFRTHGEHYRLFYPDL